jgi:hypothetical protein
MIEHWVKNEGYTTVPSSNQRKQRASRNKETQWWKRFLALKAVSSQLRIGEDEKHYMSDPSTFLVGLDISLALTDSSLPSAQHGLHDKKLWLYTLSLEQHQFRSSVMQMVMHIFYHHRFNRNLDHRLQRWTKKDYQELHASLQGDLPPSCASYSAFKDRIDHVRKAGSVYCYLAQRLGLGSLVLLRVSLVSFPIHAG